MVPTEDSANLRSLVEALKENMGREFMRERERKGKKYYTWQASYQEVCDFLDESREEIIYALRTAMNDVIQEKAEEGVLKFIPPEVAEKEISSLVESIKRGTLSEEGIQSYEKEIKTLKIIIGILSATILVMFLLAI